MTGKEARARVWLSSAVVTLTLAGCGGSEPSAEQTPPAQDQVVATTSTPGAGGAEPAAVAIARDFVLAVQRAAQAPESAKQACELLTPEAQTAAIAVLQGQVEDCPAAIASGAVRAASSEDVDLLPPIFAADGTAVDDFASDEYGTLVQELQVNTAKAADGALVVFRGSNAGVSLVEAAGAWKVNVAGALELDPSSQPITVSATAFRECFSRQQKVRPVPDTVVDTEEGENAESIDPAYGGEPDGPLLAGANDVLMFDTPTTVDQTFDTYVVTGQDSPAVASGVVEQVRAGFRPDTQDYEESYAKELDKNVQAYGSFVVKVTPSSGKASDHPLAEDPGTAFKACGEEAEDAVLSSRPRLLPGGESGTAEQDQAEGG